MRVFITGASSGIGKGLARHYAKRGDTLGLVARRHENLAELLATLPGEHAIYACDVSDANAIQAAAANFIERYGCPDIVIANAGVSAGTLTEEVEDIAVFRRVIEINLIGMMQSFQPFLSAMKARGSGRLAGIASVAGIRGLPGAGAYSASKAASISYLEALRVELRDSGIKVVTIAPGYIDTPMTERNPYPMPFMLPVDAAVIRFVRAIERGTSYCVIPWQMAIVAKCMRLLPNVLFDALFARAGRKPRGFGV